MFEALARIEKMIREHAPDVIDELHRAVDSLDQIARELARIRKRYENDARSQGVIEGTSERVS